MASDFTMLTMEPLEVVKLYHGRYSTPREIAGSTGSILARPRQILVIEQVAEIAGSLADVP